MTYETFKSWPFQEAKKIQKSSKFFAASFLQCEKDIEKKRCPAEALDFIRTYMALDKFDLSSIIVQSI